MVLKKKLVIVESPAKCKKIESILGKEYICKASYGHIKELKDVEIDKDFKPIYENKLDRKKNITELKKISEECSETIIASDLDREGEAIGYHLIEVLGLDPNTTKRIVFNEITKSSIISAINNPTKININIYNSQQARSILDRIVGFQLSQTLWKYIKTGLSAGRVQSPGLKILCERENKIENFKSEKFYKISGDFNIENIVINATLNENINNKEETQKFLETIKKSIFKIENIKSSESSRSPPQPFITSTLQQEASKVYGINPVSCMRSAQKLYEAGLITYMRTDSVQLSDKALDEIEKYIKDNYTEIYFQRRQYKNKSGNTQEAHEAIRPVDINLTKIDDSVDDIFAIKLYSLIWKRTVASQMKPLKINVNKIIIDISNIERYKFISTINRIIFDGYTKVYKNEDSEVDTDQKAVNLKKMKEGQTIYYKEIVGKEDYTRPSPRLSEADLIKDLEKKGIGRPSTYSNIITKIQERKYALIKNSEGKSIPISVFVLKDNIIKETNEEKILDAYKKKLVVTDIGKVVNDFLNKNFNTTINYTFTSMLEEKLDLIAKGELNWKQTLKEFYSLFSPTVIKLNKESPNKEEKDDMLRRLLGELDNQNKIYVTYARDGCLVVAESDPTLKKKYSKFASVPEDYNYDTITLETAKSLLIYPLMIGTYKSQDIKINNGRFGKYFTFDGKNYPIKDMTDINLSKIKEIIDNKNIKNNEDTIKEFNKNIVIKKGKIMNDKQLPPYIIYKSGKTSKFIPIPKDIEIESLTLEKVQEIIDNYKPNKKYVKKEK